ncbi:hypothetical protein DL767_000109 [Monosporascus sp. MG133]|nr:hypothetical protein DL767_000109 [Monosporascus sp. MG133]
MAPSQQHIKDLFSDVLQSQSGRSLNIQTAITDKLATIQKLMSPDIKAHVVGQESLDAGDLVGSQAILDFLGRQYMPALLTAVDTSQPINSEVVRVISGDDSPWAAVEFKTTATRKGGAPWVHEQVVIMKFDEQGKIAESRGYMNTQVTAASA